MYVNEIFSVIISKMWENFLQAILIIFHNLYLTNNSQKEKYM